MGHDREVRAARRLRNLAAKELRRSEFKPKVVILKNKDKPKKITLADYRKGLLDNENEEV